jgi:hypothetical protein
MTHTINDAGRKTRTKLRSAVSIALAASFALTTVAPAFAGMGAGLNEPASDNSLLIKVGKGGGKGGGARGRGPGGNRAVVVRGPQGGKAVYKGQVYKGQKNTVVKRTYVNKTYVNKKVVVVRPVRHWYHRPYYGNFVAGVALGTILTVGAIGVAPVAPASNLCWYWSDPAMVSGYWDYCY